MDGSKSLLEHVQQRVTEFILNDYSSVTNLKLGMLLLIYVHDIADIMFFIKSLKFPNDCFNIRT